MDFTVPPRRRPVAAVGLVALAGAGYRLAFPERSDYAGHFLAGAGGTLLLLAVVVALSQRPRPLLVVAAVWLAVLLGVGTEATIFKLAEFDLVDLANQSLGAVLAGAGLLDAARGPVVALAGLAGLGLVCLGFVLAFA